MARRFAALLFAVVVIVGALAIRNGTNRERSLSEPSRVDPSELFRDDPVAVLCAEELTAGA